MSINGEKSCFGTQIVREVFRINETMRDSDLSRYPCVVIHAECAFGAAARAAIFAGVQPSRLILKEFPANAGGVAPGYSQYSLPGWIVLF